MSYNLLQVFSIVPASLAGLSVVVGLAVGAIVGADLPKLDRFGL